MFKVTYAVKDEVIKSGSLNTNPSHSAWLERFADCELVEVETENNLFLAQDNLIYSSGEILLKPDSDFIPALITQCDELRNRITNANILNGFEWPPSSGTRFYLTQENQMNFSNLYMQSTNNLCDYPETIWTGVETLELATAQAVEDFYLAGVMYVKSCLSAGLVDKQSFRSMTLAELKQWMADNS